MPNLEQLRRLALVLPPNYRVSSSEVADVLSALIAGDEIDGLVQASDEGGAQGVVDAIHQHIADNRPDGSDEPQKGNPVFSDPQAGRAPVTGPADQVSRADFERLFRMVEGLAAAQQTSPEAAPAPASHASPAPEPTTTEQLTPEQQARIEQLQRDLAAAEQGGTSSDTTGSE